MQKNALIALALIGTLLAGAYIFHSRQEHKSDEVSSDALKDVYNQWKVEYGVHVGASEDDYRYKVFTSNYAKIIAHNSKPGQTYKLGLNSFTHLTQEEFAATHLGLDSASARPKNIIDLPKTKKQTVDWRPKLNPVKDQGQCGSCWAFSAVGAIEGLHSAQKGNLFNLAEQELVDCAGSYGNNGCNGGLMDYAFQYVISAKGLASSKDYPYLAADGQCKSGLEKSGAITSFADVEGNSDSLKAALAKQPVAVAIEADTMTFQMYKDGVINDDSCGTNLDHGVLAVGYSDEADIPYYIVRNSWGARWGDAGYVKIGIKDGQGICGIQMSASYPIA